MCYKYRSVAPCCSHMSDRWWQSEVPVPTDWRCYGGTAWHTAPTVSQDSRTIIYWSDETCNVALMRRANIISRSVAKLPSMLLNPCCAVQAFQVSVVILSEIIPLCFVWNVDLHHQRRVRWWLVCRPGKQTLETEEKSGPHSCLICLSYTLTHGVTGIVRLREYQQQQHSTAPCQHQYPSDRNAVGSQQTLSLCEGMPWPGPDVPTELRYSEWMFLSTSGACPCDPRLQLNAIKA